MRVKTGEAEILNGRTATIHLLADAGDTDRCACQPHDAEARRTSRDLNQRFIAGGEATTLIGHSAAVNLPQGLRWVPLADPVTVTVAFVSATGEQTAIVQRFREVALAHAAAHGWLDSIPESASVQPT